jgi:hypothetical protein
MRRKRFILFFAIAAVVSVALSFGLYQFGRPLWSPVYQKMVGRRTVAEVQAEFGPKVRPIWTERFQQHGLQYPPNALTLVALKHERMLEVWVRLDGAASAKVADYPVLAASGVLGPKFREGDGQVPEGIYTIEGLNPNSAYHLSMKVNYPNAFDRARASEEGRIRPGSDIFIHGKRASIGCLAMGDPAIEELFILVADAGHENTQVIIAPCDFRENCAPPSSTVPWVAGLYGQIREGLIPYTATSQ